MFEKRFIIKGLRSTSSVKDSLIWDSNDTGTHASPHSPLDSSITFFLLYFSWKGDFFQVLSTSKICQESGLLNLIFFNIPIPLCNLLLCVVQREKDTHKNRQQHQKWRIKRPGEKKKTWKSQFTCFFFIPSPTQPLILFLSCRLSLFLRWRKIKLNMWNSRIFNKFIFSSFCFDPLHSTSEHSRPSLKKVCMYIHPRKTLKQKPKNFSSVQLLFVYLTQHPSHVKWVKNSRKFEKFHSFYNTQVFALDETQTTKGWDESCVCAKSGCWEEQTTFPLIPILVSFYRHNLLFTRK